MLVFLYILHTFAVFPKDGSSHIKEAVFIMKIQESAENYLETILRLGERLPHVRSIDIVNELEFSKPSVSVAMKNLRQNGYIRMDSDGYITLTDTGMEIASKIYERHQILSCILIQLGVDPDTAAKDACRMEHVISENSFQAIKNHIRTAVSAQKHIPGW